MRTSAIFVALAARLWPTGAMAMLAAITIGGCTSGPAPEAAKQPAPAAAASPPLPFPDAVAAATRALLTASSANLAPARRGGRYQVVIDPLVDAVTGAESPASRDMAALVAEQIRTAWPQFELLEFTSANVRKAPLVVLGTFTGVNRDQEPIGPRESYRVWLTLADLASGKVLGKGKAFATEEGVDDTPTRFFRDSPAWRQDASSRAYVAACEETKVGDQIPPAFLDGILAATQIADGIAAYEAGRYQQALDHYDDAARMPFGDQLRVYNGRYLANWELGRSQGAAQAFAAIVDYGLRSGELSVKLLFRPGSTAFVADRRLSAPYPMWLDQIAVKAAASNRCIELTGHTSPTGPAVLNERLSLLRAEAIRAQLVAKEPALETRSIAAGAGSKQNIIGTGTDDASDALDRRVEFRPLAC